MKKFKARREREQQEAIVRPRKEILDPSTEILSESRPWEHDDALQDSFLDQPEVPRPVRDHYRVPKLKYRNTADLPVPAKEISVPDEEEVEEEESDDPEDEHEDDDELDEDVYTPISDRPPTLERPSPLADLTSMIFSADPEVVCARPRGKSHSTETPKIPFRSSRPSHHIPNRSRSLPPSRDGLTLSPPKTDFQIFSQRCAPSPTSASPLATTPVFELSAEEAIYSLASPTATESPIELEGSPVDARVLYPAPLHLHNKHTPETEPEASPYSRFTAIVKSSHTVNASLSTIAETEEEAASRRSSTAQVFELPVMSTIPASYSGGTCIMSRNQRYATGETSELTKQPSRNISTRSSHSTLSTNSIHSMFSFEYSNSDTEKIYIAHPTGRRESSAPSLTDVSSVDDLDLDLDLDLDAETRRSKSVSKRDAKLERFFGIRQYSISAESDSGANLDTSSSQSSSAESLVFRQQHSNQPSQSNHKHIRSSVSIDDLDLSLALENDPYKREIMLMHKSILSKSQTKQDAKLEKFFGCDKAQIELGRKYSTGSRLASNTDDLKFRPVGW